MASPEAQLAGALREGFGSPLLAVGFDAPLPDSTALAQDLRAHRAIAGSTFGAFSEPGAHFGSAVVRMPKSRERFDMNLAMAAAAVEPGGRLFAVGHNDTGARSAASHLARVARDVSVVDYKLHCRAFAAAVAEPLPFDPGAWLKVWDDDIGGERLRLHSYPGVFAHGRADAATAMLLAAMRDVRAERALDVGCGSGSIGAWLAARGCDDVTCVDVDALAIESTTLTLAPFGTNARAIPSDVYSDVTGPFTHIVTNPPFHSGVRTTSEVSQRLIREAPAQLTRGGELWLVANRFLPYADAIEEAFGSFTVEAEDRRYRVYRARR